MSLLDEARAAHARGWALTPLRGKVPTVIKWPDTPTPTEELLRSWCDSGNVGVLTGPRSGVLVIDVDEAKGGDVAALGLPPTWTTQTGGGGWHFYFWYPATATKIGNSAGKLGPHVDVRCAGGQVVLPGSIHPDTGVAYVWAEGRAPGDLPLAEVPTRVLAKLLTKPAARPARPTNGGGDAYARAALDRECAAVATASEGTRNDRLNTAAFNVGQLVAGGMLLPAHAENELQRAADAAGLDGAEAGATIRSGMKAGELNPRCPERVASVPGQRVAAEVVAPEEADSPRYVDLSRVTEVPEDPPRLVGPWLYRPDVTVFAGEFGSGKTVALFDLAYSLATGAPWLGSIEVEGGPFRVMMVDEENPEQLILYRLRRQALGRGLALEAVKDLPIHILAGNGFNLDDNSGLAAVLGEMARLKPDVVIFDSLMAMHQREENDNSDIGGFLRRRIRPIRETGAHIIFTHHLRKPSQGGDDLRHRIRGGGDICGAVDRVIGLERSNKGDLQLVSVKDRWEADPPSIAVRIEDTEDGDGLRILADKGADSSTFVARLIFDRGEPGIARPEVEAALLENGICKDKQTADRLTTKFLGKLYWTGLVAKDNKRPCRYWHIEVAPPEAERQTPKVPKIGE